MQYYIATRIENWQAHNMLRDRLQACGHKITYDWTIHGAVFQLGLDALKHVAGMETQGVLEADIVIVLWPGGRGTHVELGLAIASNKRIIFVSADVAHHNATQQTCAFYHHYLVERIYSIDDIILEVPTCEST